MSEPSKRHHLPPPPLLRGWHWAGIAPGLLVLVGEVLIAQLGPAADDRDRVQSFLVFGMLGLGPVYLAVLATAYARATVSPDARGLDELARSIDFLVLSTAACSSRACCCGSCARPAAERPGADSVTTKCVDDPGGCPGSCEVGVAS